MDLKVGLKYKVEAAGTSALETWTIKQITTNGRGDTEVLATGDRTPHARTFTPDKFKELEKKMSKKIVSESIGVSGVLSDGKEIMIERIDNWPAQERRGRKPANA